MDITTYSPPVDKLLTYGDCRNFKKWPDYSKLGLKQEHVPELIRMAIDKKLNWADQDSMEVWAPMHAWRALGQLRAVEAIEPLITLFEELEDDDWMPSELPIVYGMIGAKAIDPLVKYIESSKEDNAGIIAVSCIEEIGKQNPENRNECICGLSQRLKSFEENSHVFNSFLIASLINLKAVELLDIIKKVFEKNCVDYSIVGDLEEAEIDLGVREFRSTPRNYGFGVEPSKANKDTFEIERDHKIGRNDPCPCGSGKKYKKCCLNR